LQTKNLVGKIKPKFVIVTPKIIVSTHFSSSNNDNIHINTEYDNTQLNRRNELGESQDILGCVTTKEDHPHPRFSASLLCHMV